MTVEIISWSISTKVWYRAGIDIVSVTYTQLFYMDMTIALKLFNEMQ